MQLRTEVSSNNVKIGIKGKDQLVKQPSAPIDELRRWDAAFQPLLARSLSAGTYTLPVYPSLND